MSTVSAFPEILDWNRLDEEGRRRALSRAPASRDPGLARTVTAILRDVRERGGVALREYTRRLDGVDLDEPMENVPAVADLSARLPGRVRDAIDRAKNNIETFHAAQLPRDARVETEPGVVCERRTVPLRRVGFYVPGGGAPLLSTMLMLGVPAALAGCRDIVLCTPPGRDGRVPDALLYAARVCGIDRVYRAGGAQAVAAMAYGAACIPRVDKMFGPGNAWVTEAKRQVSQDPDGPAIDMPAGPSEVMVVADGSARADWVAADLLSQMEHGPDSQALLVTPDAGLARGVAASLAAQLELLPRAEVARDALAQCRMIRVADLGEAMQLANAHAPEHLILNTVDPESLAGEVRAAGSVFLGPWSPEAAGDYASGTNHVLPTYGWARKVSGLSVADFQLRISFQTLSRDGLRRLAPTLRALALAEGLAAHERAVACRLEGEP